MRTAAILGGGVSGAALAVRALERADGPRVVLIERANRWGRGVAYSTDKPEHLLAVRAGRMSLFEERPEDFVRWLAERAPALSDPERFVSRGLFGDYVGRRLDEAEARAPGRLVRAPAGAESLRVAGGRWRVDLAGGGFVEADAVVLATGVARPAPPAVPGLDVLDSRCITDPWDGNALAAIGRDETVLLIGAGLTAVDVLLALEGQGWRGRAIAVSRRGLLPRAHAEPHGPAAIWTAPGGTLSTRLNAFRRAARRTPWRELMEALRPQGQALWLGLGEAERARFLRHLRPWWDAHRHRMAPAAAERVSALAGAGRLLVLAARLTEVVPGERPTAVLRRRGARVPERLVFDRAVVCTGPEPDPRLSDDPLWRGLLAEGIVGVGPFGYGVAATADGRVRTRPDAPPLWAMGVLLKGVLWETVAVPELRLQAERLARAL